MFLTGRDSATLAAAERDIAGATAFQSDVADLHSTGARSRRDPRPPWRIDVLMINARVGGFATVRDATPEIWNLIHGVNLRGAFFAVQKALPLMGKGRIHRAHRFSRRRARAARQRGLCAGQGQPAHRRPQPRHRTRRRGHPSQCGQPGPTETPIINHNSGMDASAVSAMRAMIDRRR